MGLILDSSVLIAAERQGQNARQTLIAVSDKAGNTDIALSVVTIIELAHGVARGYTGAKRNSATVYSGTAHCAACLPGYVISVSH
jgi:predicted nucleic acid-binding protein